MPFFPQSHFSPEASLFQLLSELDQPQHKTCVVRRHRPEETFTPRFDVTEVANAYELYGEVAGLEPENLSIEFSDAQTLVIKGKTARGTTVATSATESQTTETASEKPDSGSHNATVEDEYDAADTPLTTPETAATAAESKATEKQEQQPQTAKPKYWVAERRVGSFARNFSFSQRIEQDEVVASLKSGVLHVVVPKSQKSKKVAVNVN
ncbi:HSP20-like chaperone [Bisporella sp. PMI_857]|nr:HSP20-like chaperone [Bisporella sp. PMI_857]